jgi:hypothetical protein
MTAVVTALDAGTAGSLEICTAAYASVLAAITIQKPSFTESSGVLTLAGPPGTPLTATAGNTGTAAVARFKSSAAAIIITGLTVGVGTGDLQLNSTSITSGQTVSITGTNTITHSP